MEHGITYITTERANEYRYDGGRHTSEKMQLKQQNRELLSGAHRGINISPGEFTNMMKEVQETISTGVERGLAVAFNASAALCLSSLFLIVFFFTQISTGNMVMTRSMTRRQAEQHAEEPIRIRFLINEAPEVMNERKRENENEESTESSNEFEIRSN